MNMYGPEHKTIYNLVKKEVGWVETSGSLTTYTACTSQQ